MGFHIAVDIIFAAKKLEGAGELLEEMANDDFVETRIGSTRILASHVVGSWMGNKLLPLLDEEGQVAQFAIFHNEVDVSSRFETVMKGNDVRMPQGLEDLDFAIEIFLEFLIQSLKLDRFDGNSGLGFLWRISICMDMIHSPTPCDEVATLETYLVPTHIDLGKTTLADLFVDDKLSHVSATPP